jgi:ketosteroid isomerase-like protein
MDDTPIRQVMEAYQAAVFAKDVDAIVALYDQDVRVFDLWSTWSYDGAEAWRGMVAGWFDSLGTAQVAVGWMRYERLWGTISRSPMR